MDESLHINEWFAMFIFKCIFVHICRLVLTDELILILLYSTVVRIRLYKLNNIIPKYQNGQQFLLCHI